MPDYQEGKIYKIVSLQTDKIYIGSTTQRLTKRKIEHKANYNSYLKGKYRNTTSFEIMKLEDVDIILLESFPCDTKEQLLLRERYYIQNTKNCVNKTIPMRTRKEYNKDNKDKIKQYKKTPFICSCNQTMTIHHKSRHLKTNKHKKKLELKNIENQAILPPIIQH